MEIYVRGGLEGKGKMSKLWQKQQGYSGGIVVRVLIKVATHS